MARKTTSSIQPQPKPTIKKLILDEICEHLRRLGIPEKKIIKARRECEKPGADDSALWQLFRAGMADALKPFFKPQNH